jgi:chromosome segregation ATPase
MRAHVTRLVVLAGLGLIGQAHAQSNEDRLRDALRESVAQMRAAQDQAAQAQADLQKAQQDRAAVQAQLDAANAKLAQAKPATPPADLARLNDALAASKQQAAALQALLAKYQSAYQGLAAQAQAQDTQGQILSRGLKSQTQALDTCKSENKQLTGVAEDILHLYQTQDFRGLLIRSYEPLIGTAKVRLENLVQDYDDKIHNQEYIAEPAKR